MREDRFQEEAGRCGTNRNLKELAIDWPPQTYQKTYASSNQTDTKDRESIEASYFSPIHNLYTWRSHNIINATSMEKGCDRWKHWGLRYIRESQGDLSFFLILHRLMVLRLRKAAEPPKYCKNSRRSRQPELLQQVRITENIYLSIKRKSKMNSSK